MKVALVGYGKMGQSIEKILLDRGHVVSLTIDADNTEEIGLINQESTDVAIEFTSPDTAPENIMTCMKNGVPVVSGSTGWMDRYEEVEKYCQDNRGSFFYASNYSIGVNIFFKLNQHLAKLMKGQPYDPSIREVHHTQKLDAPSGTAITLAEGLIEFSEKKHKWVNLPTSETSALEIISERTDAVPGTHIINYASPIDDITISHTAHSRQGFALGAVLAAEWLPGKSGVFSMDDLLDF